MIAAAIAALAADLTAALTGQDATITTDYRDVPGILAAGHPAVLITPPELAWPDVTHEVWIIAATDDPADAIAAMDPIITAITDEPTLDPDSARPDTFNLGATRVGLPGYILTITR